MIAQGRAMAGVLAGPSVATGRAKAREQLGRGAALLGDGGKGAIADILAKQLTGPDGAVSTILICFGVQKVRERKPRKNSGRGVTTGFAIRNGEVALRHNRPPCRTGWRVP